MLSGTNKSIFHVTLNTGLIQKFPSLTTLASSVHAITMSKSISFSFGSQATGGTSTPRSTAGSKIKTIRASLPAFGGKPQPTTRHARSSHLREDSDQEDDAVEKVQEISGLGTNGVVLAVETAASNKRVIECKGNGNWMNRGRRGKQKGALPGKESLSGEHIVERDEVSRASGLSFVQKKQNNGAVEDMMDTEDEIHPTPEKESYSVPQDADSTALSALLDPASAKPTQPFRTIEIARRNLSPQNEDESYASDVRNRPDAPSLDDYHEMPVEDFGWALLRGMGRKRRANGEVIPDGPTPETEDEKRRRQKLDRTQNGFLGIGAKMPAKTKDGEGKDEVVELGAWGKAEMRKANKGQVDMMYTPVALRNKVTGEVITEAELARRKEQNELLTNGANGKHEDKDSWRERSRKDREADGEKRMITNGDGADTEDGSKRRRSRSRDHYRHRDDRDRDRRQDRDHDDRHNDKDRDGRHRDSDRDRHRHR